MPPLRTILNWPWHWLLETSTVPGQVQVNPSVQPTLDAGQHNPRILPFREAFVMALGLNTIVLPGLGRLASLNPATFPSPTSAGARRWLALAVARDIVFAAGDNVQLTYATPGSAPGGVQALAFLQGASAWPGGLPYPLIRGNSFVGSEHVGLQAAPYVPDPDFLFLSIAGQGGGEVVTVSGLFLEAETRNQPLPDMFA